LSNTGKLKEEGYKKDLKKKSMRRKRKKEKRYVKEGKNLGGKTSLLKTGGQPPGRYTSRVEEWTS